MKKLEGINIGDELKKAKALIEAEENLSPALRAMLNMLLLIVRLMMNRLGMNSKNSSTSPSQDPNRKKKKAPPNPNKKPGGQNGRIGKRLDKVTDPDITHTLLLDKRTLPHGHVYTEAGYETRQVFDIEIKRQIIEYRAQILLDENGKKYVAAFPEEVRFDVQYGSAVKAHSVYMSQYQLIPYERVAHYFTQQMGLPLCVGTVFNFNKEAYDLLEAFERIAKTRLTGSALLHTDETGINVNQKRWWLHVASNGFWTHYYPHQQRGAVATNEIGIVPQFKGVLCHDHWKPYYTFTKCLHSLCNAHHLRELTRAFEQDEQQWAEAMIKLLLAIKKAVDDSEAGALNEVLCQQYQTQYLEILEAGKLECPLAPVVTTEKPKRGRLKQSKSRNLLDRLINYHEDVLRFMSNIDVPFTNNQAERDIRMTKVQQKISGCFRSIEGAKIFCRVRGYLSTCGKHGVNMTEALSLLFKGKMPDFVYNSS